MVAVGVLLPLLAGRFVAGRLLPGHGRILRAAVAFGLAVGVTSVEYFLTLLIVGRASRTASLIAAIALPVGAWFFRAKRPPAPAPLPKRTWWLWPAAAFAGWIGVEAATGLLGGLTFAPHGAWDAVAIWNVRARGLARGGPDWRDAFHPSHPHTDYPLLVPATVARLWAWAGDEPPLAGGLFGVACLAGIVAFVGAGVGRLRGREVGCLAVGFLLANRGFVADAWFQYADVPLSFYLTGAVVVWVVGRNTEGPGERDPVRGPMPTVTAPDPLRGSARPAVVVGLFLGLAAWTKNEGLAFAGVFLLAASIEALRRRDHRRDWRGLAVGFAVAFAVVLVFKLTVSAANDLVEGQNRDTLAKLTDPARYRAILEFGWDYFFDQPWYVPIGLPLVVVALGFGPRVRGMLVPTVAVVGTAAVYFFVYVTTPRDLAWHLGTSFSRLVTHLMPAAYFLGFVMLRPVRA